jgi:hypothetical protein
VVVVVPVFGGDGESPDGGGSRFPSGDGGRWEGAAPGILRAIS